MGKIILLKHIKDMVISQNLANIVLFGETNLIDDGTNSYDLIFYAKGTYPYEVERITSLVIPVLRVKDKDEAINRIYGLFLKYPDFSKYATLRHNQDFVDFYEVCPTKIGKEINLLGKYNVVEEHLLFSQSLDEQFEPMIEKKIRAIDAKYKSVAENYN